MAEDTILENSKSSVDFHVHPPGDSAAADRDKITVRSAADLLAQRGVYRDANIDCLFVHVSQCDAAGHAATWDSDEYRRSISQVDIHIGELLEAIAGRPARDEEAWLVIVTTDHAGPADELNHADNTNPQTFRIPFIVWGDGIQHQALESASLYDVAPTVLHWMGVEKNDLPGKPRGVH